MRAQCAPVALYEWNVTPKMDYQTQCATPLLGLSTNVHQLPCMNGMSPKMYYQTQCATPSLGLSPNVHQLPCARLDS